MRAGPERSERTRDRRACALGWIAAFFLVPAAAFAQGFSGHAEAKGFGFFDSATSRDPLTISWRTVIGKQEFRLGPVFGVVSARAEAISGEEADDVRFDPADRSLRRSPLSIREAYLRVPVAGLFDLQLGRFELGWGKTDGYSPADAFLPRDLSDPFANEKLPLWGARISGQSGDVRYDLFGAATTTPWRLPVLEGRYAPLPVAGVFLVDGRSDPPRKGFAALRVLATHEEWDFGIWARSGARPAPLLVFRTDLVRPAADGWELPVDRRYVDERGVGVEVSRLFGAWIVRAEAAWLESDDAELGDALLASIGAERAFGDGTWLLTLSDNARETNAPAALLFDRAILPAFISVWNQTEDWGRWKAAWTVGLEEWDGLLSAEINASLTDEFSIGFGVDWPYGSEKGVLGALGKARRVWAGARRSW